MANCYPIGKEEIQAIIERGCCLGKYRILLTDGYYCILDNAFDCTHQDKVYVKNLEKYMAMCKTNEQRPCAECERYMALDDSRGNKAAIS